MTEESKTTETAATETGKPAAGAATAGAVAAAPAAKPKKDGAAQAERPEPTVVVTGPEQGRWRIGRKFTREPVSIPLDQLGDGDLDRLKADPALVVQVIDAPH